MLNYNDWNIFKKSTKNYIFDVLFKLNGNHITQYIQRNVDLYNSKLIPTSNRYESNIWAN